MPRTPLFLLIAALAWGAATSVASAKTVEVTTTIQAAIDAPDTVDGDTIQIPAGDRYEHVLVNKSLRLVGAGAGSTVLTPTIGTEPVIKIDAAGTQVVIENLTVRGAGVTNGIVVAAGSATLIAVRVGGFTAGTGVDGVSATRLDLLGNTITGNQTGLALATTPGTLRGNRIAGNTTAGLTGSSAADATRNWWGCNGGPGTTSGCNGVTGGATTSPHLVLRLRSAFSQIATGGAKTDLVADLTRDSSDTFAGTAFADGTGLTFETTLGTLAPTTAPTISGSAATTLTSGDTPGDAAPSVTLDQQKVFAPVTFVAPPPTQTVTVTQTTTAPPTTETVTAPPATPPPTTPPDAAQLLANARRALGSNVERLARSLTPGVAFVPSSVRTGRGTLTVPDQDIVSLLVIACPEVACQVSVGAIVTRRSASGRKTKPYDLRRATFPLAAGRQRVVAVRLTPSRRVAIRAAKRATMTVTMAVSDAAGNRVEKTMIVRLKIKR